MANPKVHLYRAIWIRLKQKGTARLECHPDLFARVKKAVIKEKHKDHKWRVANSHDSYRLAVTYDAEKHQATFTLKAKFGIEDRRVG
jgi:hypothetical protein